MVRALSGFKYGVVLTLCSPQRRAGLPGAGRIAAGRQECGLPLFLLARSLTLAQWKTTTLVRALAALLRLKALYFDQHPACRTTIRGDTLSSILRTFPTVTHLRLSHIASPDPYDMTSCPPRMFTQGLPLITSIEGCLSWPIYQHLQPHLQQLHIWDAYQLECTTLLSVASLAAETIHTIRIHSLAFRTLPAFDDLSLLLVRVIEYAVQLTTLLVANTICTSLSPAYNASAGIGEDAIRSKQLNMQAMQRSLRQFLANEARQRDWDMIELSADEYPSLLAGPQGALLLRRKMVAA